MIQDCENVVHFLRDNEIKPRRGCLPKAFRLRNRIKNGKEVKETFISVDRTCLPTFEKDAKAFSCGKNSKCAVLKVAEIRNSEFEYNGHTISYDVKSEPSFALSHGGIYIYCDGKCVMAGYLETIDKNKNPGQEKSLLTNFVRSRLANLASMHILNINDVIDLSKEDQCLKKL